jgi:hypothetical protein
MGKKGKGNRGGSKRSNKGKNYETLDDDYSKGKTKGKKNSHGKKSGRRHGHHHRAFISTADDLRFRQSVEEGGSHSIIDVASDGNCLFRSISDQLYHDYGKMHSEIRNDVCDFLESHEEEFSVFLVLDENEEDEDASSFEAYISAMREDGEWGGNLELVGGARLYRRNITVFSSVGAAFTIEHGPEKSSGPDLIVSYHDNDHYNSVRNSASPFPSLPSKFMPEKAKNPEEDEGSIKEEDDKKEDSDTEKNSRGGRRQGSSAERLGFQKYNSSHIWRGIRQEKIRHCFGTETKTKSKRTMSMPKWKNL